MVLAVADLSSCRLRNLSRPCHDQGPSGWIQRTRRRRGVESDIERRTTVDAIQKRWRKDEGNGCRPRRRREVQIRRENLV